MPEIAVQTLPIEIWAQVARYLPTVERVPAFYALRRAMIIPTHNTLHETMLRFLEVAAADEKRDDLDVGWPTAERISPDDVHVLVEMGFESNQVLAALVQAGGQVDIAIVRLVIGR